MEPITEDKTGRNQEEKQKAERNNPAPQRPGWHRYLIMSALAVILVFAAVLAVFMTRSRENSSVIAGMDYHEAVVDNKIYTSYSQHDTRWSSSPLGSSKDTMGSSGCLTSCIAASLTAQGIHSFSPGELNQIFNEKQVYNGHGAIVWKKMEQALPYARVRLDCGTTSESIDILLDENKYPIVKVRRKSGAVHWIMLTGTEKDTHDITAMDPIDGFVHMSDYDNRIYGVRVVTGAGETREAKGEETAETGRTPEASPASSEYRPDGTTPDETGKAETNAAANTGRGEEWTEGFRKTEEAFAQKEILPVSIEDLADAPDAQGVVFLSALSQNKFRLYGYAGPEGHYDGIYIMDWEGNMNSFPTISYTSPRLILPKMGWNQENGILEASFHTMTGTSLSREQFYAFLRYDTGHLEPYEFRIEDYKKQLDRRLSYKLDKEKHTVTFYDESEKVVSLPLGDLDSSRIRDVIYTDFVTFKPSQPAIMEFTPGFIMEGTITPQYLESDIRLEAAIDVIRDADASGADVVKFHIRDIEKGGA